MEREACRCDIEGAEILGTCVGRGWGGGALEVAQEMDDRVTMGTINFFLDVNSVIFTYE